MGGDGLLTQIIELGSACRGVSSRSIVFERKLEYFAGSKLGASSVRASAK